MTRRKRIPPSIVSAKSPSLNLQISVPWAQFTPEEQTHWKQIGPSPTHPKTIREAARWSWRPVLTLVILVPRNLLMTESITLRQIFTRLPPWNLSSSNWVAISRARFPTRVPSPAQTLSSITSKMIKKRNLPTKFWTWRKRRKFLGAGSNTSTGSFSRSSLPSRSITKVLSPGPENQQASISRNQV